MRPDRVPVTETQLREKYTAVKAAEANLKVAKANHLTHLVRQTGLRVGDKVAIGADRKRAFVTGWSMEIWSKSQDQDRVVLYVHTVLALKSGERGKRQASATSVWTEGWDES